MYSKVNYTIVGIFVVLFSIGMIWFAFWLAKYGLQENYKLYKIEMKDSIAGLSKDSSVKLHGVDIGRVYEIRIDPKDIEKINIFVQIKEGVPIKEDMVATTQMLGVTGLLSIEIHGGSNEAKTLVPTDKYIPVIKSKPSLLSNLTDTLGNLSVKISTLLTRSESLLSSQNIDNVGKILNHIETIASQGVTVEHKAIASMQEVDKSLQDFRLFMRQLQDKLSQATQNFRQLQNDFSDIKNISVPTIKTLQHTTKNFNRTILKVEKSLDRGDYSLKKILEPAVIDIQILVKQMSRISRELEQNPSAVLFKSTSQRKGPGE